MTDATDQLRTLIATTDDADMRAYYRLCLKQLALAPIRPPEPHAPVRCWRGKTDMLLGMER